MSGFEVAFAERTIQTLKKILYHYMEDNTQVYSQIDSIRFNTKF